LKPVSAIILSALIAVCLLFGCADDQRLTPIPAQATILAFGDSLTVGVGAAKSNSYPAVLAEISGREVVSAGISGETTDEGLTRFPRVIAETQPDLIVLLEGGNDILRGRSDESIKSNLAGMIKLAQDENIPIVLLAVPQKSLLLGAAPFYAELADEYQLVADNQLIGKLLRNPSYKSDQIHFNKAGYKALAEGVGELLRNNGAL